MMTKKEMIIAIDTAYRAIDRACDRDTDCARWFRAAHEVALRQEREHRAMGSRFTNGQASYQVSALTAARYFVCKWALESKRSTKTTWQAAQATREDARLSYALADRLHQLGTPVTKLVAKPVREIIQAIDYSLDIANG